MILACLALVAVIAIGALAPAWAKPARTRIIVNTALADQIIRSASRLGINPLDLGTVISYETAGTFDPRKRGPVTQHGRHIGLIQFGEPQRREHGYDPNGDLDGQFKAVESYLTKAGVKPGTGLLDLYSAINAGSVGLHNRSDANNGGAPGTVKDKVRNQMSGHRQKAADLLAGRIDANINTAALDDGDDDASTSAPVRTATGRRGGAAGGGDTFEDMMRSFTEPTQDARRLAIREIAHPLLADLLPDGQGQAVAQGDSSGQPPGLAALSSLLGQDSPSPGIVPPEETV